MNDPFFFLVLGATLLATGLLVSWSRRWNLPAGSRWLFLSTIPAGFLAVSLLVEYAGTAGAAQLVRKTERITPDSGGDVEGGWPTWERSLVYTISFQPSGGARTLELTLRTDSATFDRLPPQGPIKIRYFHWAGLLTYVRWVRESPFAFIGMLWEIDVLRWCVLTAVAIAAWVAAWREPRGSRRQRRARRRAPGAPRRILRGIGPVPLCAWIVWNLYRAFVPGPMPDPSWLPAQAGVVLVSTWAGASPRPYSFVGLRFRPEGYAGEVVAVDTVDTSSIVGLARGHRAEVRYPLGHPRGARMVGVTRTHAWVDKVPALIVLVGGAAIVAFIAWRQSRGAAVRALSDRS